MLKVCHISDVHLGFRKYSKLTKNGLNQREVDVSLAFREAVDRMIVLKPQLVLIAGDLFHSVRPSNTVVTFCFKEIRRLQHYTGANIVIIAGNHESPKRADSGCIIRLLGEIPNVSIADNKMEVFNFKDIDCSVTALPHLALVNLGDTRLRADDRFKYNVLVTHGQIGERWISDFGGVTLDLNRLSPHEWSYVALGHVHLPRQVSHNCWYSGAIEHTANNIWAEGAENKGFLEINLEQYKVTFHPLTTPRQVVNLPELDGAGLSPDEVTNLIQESLVNISGGISGKIVRLEVRNVQREVYRQLDHKLLRQYRNDALHLSLEIRPPESAEQKTTLTSGKKIRLEDSLAVFCSKWETDNPETRKKLEALIQGYLLKLEEGRETSQA